MLFYQRLNVYYYFSKPVYTHCKRIINLVNRRIKVSMSDFTPAQVEQLKSLLLKTVDFHKRRITNAAPSRSLSDYTIQSELGNLTIINATEADFKFAAELGKLYLFNDLTDGFIYLAIYDGNFYYRTLLTVF